MQPILKIDLSARIVERFIIPGAWERAFLGGASLAARLLYPYLTKDLDPLSPDAPLLFLNGPLSGTAGPTVGRFVVCGMGAATHLWAESNCGGFWGPELRFAGWDGVWITGRAEQPVYLWVNGDQVEIITSRNQYLSADWEQFVITNKARIAIRRFVNEQSKAAIQKGKEKWEKKARKLKQRVTDDQLARVAPRGEQQAGHREVVRHREPPG